MKMKNLLIGALSVVTVAAVSIGGTLAYLQSEDNDTNTMTLGKVEIEQKEYQREADANGDYITDEIDNKTSYVLEAFENDKALLPVTELDSNGNVVNYGAGGYDATTVRMTQVGSHGGVSVFASENAVDKFVTVTNTGKTDAYVRTLVALELGSLTVDEFNEVVKISSRSIDDDADYSQPWFHSYVGEITVDGHNYALMEFVYHGAETSSGMKHANGVLPAGETTYPSLCQVYMTAAATNEDCEAIDGNANGKYDVLVYSQAVQAAGFDDAETALNAAFGDITESNHPWS